MLALALAALLQGAAWSTWPPAPTVGDTVWIERRVAAPDGWRVRPGRLDATAAATPLGEAAVLREPGGWLVRYAVALWTAGEVRLTLPAVWRLGPGGEADSLDAQAAVVSVRSVLPARGGEEPAPRPALAPLWPDVRRPAAPLVSAGVALAGLIAAVAWRRRRPRALPPPEPPAADPPVADQRWLDALEPRAVAARAAAGLRAAVARAVPAAHPGPAPRRY